MHLFKVSLSPQNALLRHFPRKSANAEMPSSSKQPQMWPTSIGESTYALIVSSTLVGNAGKAVAAQSEVRAV